MSRKKSKHRQAVPEEILAEGSGPAEVHAAEAAPAEGKKGRKAVKAHEAEEPVEDTPEAADEVVEDEAVAATEDPKKARGRRKKASEPEVQPADAESEAVAASEVDVTVEAKPKKKSRRRAKDAASDDTDAESASADESDAMSADADAVAMSAEADGDAVSMDADADAVAMSADADADGDAVSMDADADTAAGADAVSAMGGDDADARVASSDDEIGTSGDATEGDLAASAVASTDASDGDDVVGDPITDEAGVEAALLPGTLSPVQLRHLIEALIFATDKPVTLQRLRQLTRVSDVTRIEQALAELHEDYKDRGIALHQVSGGYQFRTNTAFSTWVQQLIQGRPVRLSRAQLETLAIVAYRQPITRPEIDEIRGVDSSATLRLLLDRSLIRVLGKKEEVGRPTLYGTTKEFLDFFSLSDLRELPTLREYSELTAESRQVMSDRLGVALDANGELLEPESEDSLGEVDRDADQAPQDQASIVDSILAEHAAAEAEAEARLDAREIGDLAEAAMAGGSPVAMRDIFSDEPDPETMMMSGEMSPVGSEARSYVDAIRAGALTEPDLERESDDVELRADASGEIGHLEASDESVAAVLEAEEVSRELASESDDVAATSDAVELASEDLLAASEDLAAVVADEVAEAKQAHMGTSPGEATELRADESESQAGPASVEASIEAEAIDEVELRADEPERRGDEGESHVGLADVEASTETEAIDEVELRADEPESHVGPADVEASAMAEPTDNEVELRSDEPESHVGLADVEASTETEAIDEVELRADEPESHVGPADNEASAKAEPTDNEVELRADEPESHVAPADNEASAKAEPTDNEVELRADEAESHMGMSDVEASTETEAIDEVELRADEPESHVEPADVERIAAAEALGDDDHVSDGSVDDSSNPDDSDAN